MPHLSEWFHFDPVNLAVVLILAAGAWFTLKNESRWHTQWIEKHSRQHEENERMNSNILMALQTSNAHLSTLVESHHDRIGRIEAHIDRQTQIGTS